MTSKVAAMALAVFFGIIGSAHAQKQRVGSWTVETADAYTEAFTGNDSGSTFGFLCIAGTCSFYLDTNTRCEEDSKTPLLVNANSGSTYVVSSCLHFRSSTGTRYINSISDKDVVTAISSGRVIGFAMPLANGDFKVTRFSLEGAMAATTRAVDGMNARPKVRDTGLRDRTY